MKRCYLDANVLLYLQDVASPFHNEAKTVITKLLEKNYRPTISSLVLDEYLHTSLRLSGKSKQEMKISLIASIKNIFALPGITFVNPPLEAEKHLRVIELMVGYNLHPRDAYHLFIMKVNKITYFVTFDKDFDRIFASSVLKRANDV